MFKKIVFIALILVLSLGVVAQVVVAQDEPTAEADATEAVDAATDSGGTDSAAATDDAQADGGSTIFTTSNANLVLDIVLILAAFWMVASARGIGGVVGRTLTAIVIGTVILGFAHLQATLTATAFGTWNGTIHRVVVLIGFVFLIYGFRQISVMKR